MWGFFSIYPLDLKDSGWRRSAMGKSVRPASVVLGVRILACQTEVVKIGSDSTSAKHGNMCQCDGFSTMTIINGYPVPQ